MRSYIEKDFVLKFNKLYRELFTLESMLRTIKNVCLNNDINTNHQDDSISISNERNDYINILTEALIKIEKIKQINDTFCDYLEIL